MTTTTATTSWLMSSFNRLLPFATPGTPLLQDLLHLAAVCLFLYLAPHIQERLQQYRTDSSIRHDDQRTRISSGALPDGEQQGALVDGGGVDRGGVFDNDGENVDVRNAAPQQFPDDLGFDDRAPGDAEIGEQAQLADPANPGAAAATTATARPVGAKKAKSLARRDQRRAHNEFLRAQGDAQRARDAEGAGEREAAQAAERERRIAATQALEERRARENAIRREREQKDREEEIKRKEEILRMVREKLEGSSVCDLSDVAKRVSPRDRGDVVDWVEKVVRASDILVSTADMKTFITGYRFVVRVTEKQMHRLYEEMMTLALDDGSSDDENEDGTISREVLGRRLEKILQNQSRRRW